MDGHRHTEYLVMRHGQSTADVSVPAICEGRLDTPLSKKGLEQARLAADWIAQTFPPDRIISSTLSRATMTADEIAGRTGVAVEHDDALIERNNGVLAGMIREEARSKGLLRRCAPGETVEGGETLIALRARAELFWSSLPGQKTAGRRILIVSHGQMIDMLFQCFLGLPLEERLHLRTGDTGIHCWRAGTEGRSILFCNSQEHLPIHLR